MADLLFTAKRDKLGVGGGESSFCFYLEAINEQELSEVKPQSRARCFASYRRSMQRSTPGGGQGWLFKC